MSELADLNTNLGSYYGFSLFPDYGKNQPSKIYAWNKPVLGAAWFLGAGLAGYAKFVKGFNILWLVGGFAPFWTATLYNHIHQPSQHIQNCYSYLLAKRQATVELQQAQARFNEQDFA